MFVILSLIFGLAALVAKFLAKHAALIIVVTLLASLAGLTPWTVFFSAIGISVLATVLSPLFIGVAQGFLEAQENKSAARLRYRR